MRDVTQVQLLRYEGDKTWFEITLREGRNQQIRRMGDATRFPVMRLARTSFAGVTTEGGGGSDAAAAARGAGVASEGAPSPGDEANQTGIGQRLRIEICH